MSYQPPISLRFVDNTYDNIFYNVFINSLDPDKGALNYSLLRHNVNVSCYIKVPNSDIYDYEYAIITLAYKQVSAKTKRYKNALKNKEASNVLYRDGLESLINHYKESLANDSCCQIKALLLNDGSDPIDSRIGDTAVQCMFRYKKFDGSSEYELYPGRTYGKIASVIGLSVFQADSVEEVFHHISSEMTSILTSNVLMYSRLNNTVALSKDIQRYIDFFLRGD